MLRVYLDWDVISKFKLEQFNPLLEFLKGHKDRILVPFTPTHFSDLMKSYNEVNVRFDGDLEMLGVVCGRHFMQWKDHQIEPLLGEPREYFNHVKNQQPINLEELLDMDKLMHELDSATSGMGLPRFGTLLKVLMQTQPAGLVVERDGAGIMNQLFPGLQDNSTMWDIMRGIGPLAKGMLDGPDKWKELRNSIAAGGFSVAAIAGDTSAEQAAARIDAFLRSKQMDMSFIEYVESTFKHQKEPPDDYEFFTRAYLMLDLIGYRSDKLQKPTNSMMNIWQDAEHAFYGAHCDYLVAFDKRLRGKAVLLYHLLNIPTEVIHPMDLVEDISGRFHSVPHDFAAVVEDAIAQTRAGQIVEEHAPSEHLDTKAFGIKLPTLYLNFFTHVIFQGYEGKGIVLTFRKVFKNYSRFVYYTESEAVLDTIIALFGLDDMAAYPEKKREFVYGDNAPVFMWHFAGGLIKLEREEDTHRPSLTFVLAIGQEPGDQL